MVFGAVENGVEHPACLANPLPLEILRKRALVVNYPRPLAPNSKFRYNCSLLAGWVIDLCFFLTNTESY